MTQMFREYTVFRPTASQFESHFWVYKPSIIQHKIVQSYDRLTLIRRKRTFDDIWVAPKSWQLC